MRKTRLLVAIMFMFGTFFAAQAFAASVSNEESHIQTTIGVKTTPQKDIGQEEMAPAQTGTYPVGTSEESHTQTTIGVKTTPQKDIGQEEMAPAQTGTYPVGTSEESHTQTTIGVKTTPDTEKAGEYPRWGSDRVSMLMGKKITNNKGEELGTIEDVVYGRDGRINYVIISRPNYDKWTPIPWASVHAGTVGGTYVVDIDRVKLENAPSFEKDKWTDFEDKDWNENVGNYYGHESYQKMKKIK